MLKFIIVVVKVIKYFIDVKSSGRLSKRLIPKNAKLKEAAHLDADYSSTKKNPY